MQRPIVVPWTLSMGATKEFFGELVMVLALAIILFPKSIYDSSNRKTARSFSTEQTRFPCLVRARKGGFIHLIRNW